VLGLLSAVGPFAIDMYLPALPAISADLHASTSATQMTLIAFFVSFGLCQIFYGPLSDVYGRKLPLYGGLALFILGAIGCALSPTIAWPIAFRFLQGIGAAMGVIPHAIIRDLHTGAEATYRRRSLNFQPPLSGSLHRCGSRENTPTFRNHPIRGRVVDL
jgi:MFS transporter, DHA1 family, multidrug resistance protein